MSTRLPASKAESLARVAQYYDSDPQREWSRFDRHLFEFPVTLFYLQKYLQPGSTILDVGSGPGRYAIALAQAGHQVALLDLSRKLLDIAREKVAEQRLPITQFHVGSATDLSSFGTATQDAVLCLGPMYHLTEQEDRDAAMHECLRVLKPGGLLYVAFISVLGRVFDIVRNYPETLPAALDQVVDMVTGAGAASHDEHKFTDAYFVQPQEVQGLMARYPAELIALVGVEGLTSQSARQLTSIDDKVSQAWIDLAVQTAATQAALYGSDHLLWVGRKLPLTG